MSPEFPSCSTCRQTECFINKYCSEEWKNKISENKSAGIYEAKQTIFRENNIVFGVYFICKGSVKVFKNCTQKKQYIVRLASSGEMIGLRGLTEKNYRINCSAFENTVLCFIEKIFLNDIIKANPEFALALIQFYSEQLSTLELRLKHLAYFNTRERVAEALLMLNKYFGKTTEQGILVNESFSQHDIAYLAGTTIEEVNRTLSVFKKEKIITTIKDRKIVLLNTDKLNEIILENCCDKDVNIKP